MQQATPKLSSQNNCVLLPHTFCGLTGLVGWFFCWSVLESPMRLEADGARSWSPGVSPGLDPPTWCLVFFRVAFLSTWWLILRGLSTWPFASAGHLKFHTVVGFQECESSDCPAFLRHFSQGSHRNSPDSVWEGDAHRWTQGGQAHGGPFCRLATQKVRGKAVRTDDPLQRKQCQARRRRGPPEGGNCRRLGRLLGNPPLPSLAEFLLLQDARDFFIKATQ